MNTVKQKWALIQITLLKYLGALLIFGFAVFPFFWMLSCSFKGPHEILAIPPRFVPAHLTLANYSNAFQHNHILVYLINSLIITIGATALTILIGSLAAYALNFFHFKGSALFTGILVMVQALPVVVALVPLFILFKTMGILNTRLALILAYTASTWGIPVAVILLSGYFTEIPKAIFESASIDGCSTLGIFAKMIIPLAFPGIFATAIYNFVMVWQEFLLAVSLLSDKKLYTLPLGLSDFIGMYSTDWGGLMATAVIIAIPSLIVFVSAQNRFINNLAGSVKQ